MSKTGHVLYIVLLIGTGAILVAGVGIYGADYYLTPFKERPFHPQYELLKPTGLLGHGYGIIGSLMVLLGVTIYSARKRLRVFGALGRIKHFLEFHIFLCLTGPCLVLFHTTFKIGGLVAVSFWSMTAVVLSGFVGRYIYVQIPKGIHGHELTKAELIAQSKSLGERLERGYGLPANLIERIDALAQPRKPIEQLSAFEMLVFFVASDLTHKVKLRRLASSLRTRRLKPSMIHQVLTLAKARMALSRRIAFLEKLRAIFHLWHVIHLPFSIIMFVILFVHVGVAIAFGYHWIW